MKLQTVYLAKEFTQSQKEDLNNEGNENLIIQFKKQNEKTFAVVDLWNIHRLKRNRAQRRF